MSTRIEIIDGIRSSTTANIDVQSIETYNAAYNADDFGDNDQINKIAVAQMIAAALPVIYSAIVYNIPLGSATPIIINFDASTIKYGTNSPIQMQVNSVDVDLSNYKLNPDIKFKYVVDDTNSRPIGGDAWIINEEWDDDSQTSLKALTLSPDADVDGNTMYNTNIIIKT